MDDTGRTGIKCVCLGCGHRFCGVDAPARKTHGPASERRVGRDRHQTFLNRGAACVGVGIRKGEGGSSRFHYGNAAGNRTGELRVRSHVEGERRGGFRTVHIVRRQVSRSERLTCQVDFHRTGCESQGGKDCLYIMRR